MAVLACLNAAVGLASVCFGAVALCASGRGRQSGPEAGDHTFAQLYGVRAVPVGLLAAVAPWMFGLDGAVGILACALAAQVGDVIVGIQRRVPGMAVGAGFAALVHGALIVASHL